MIHFAPGEVAHYYATRAPKLRQTRAAQWRGPCPIHNGKKDNLSVDPKTGLWRCWSGSGGAGGDIIAFECAINSAGFLDAVRTVEDIVGRQGTEQTFRKPC